jgi:hypothetical protein
MIFLKYVGWNGTYSKCVLEYMGQEREGTGMAYQGLIDWMPDPELDSDKDKY